MQVEDIKMFLKRKYIVVFLLFFFSFNLFSLDNDVSEVFVENSVQETVVSDDDSKEIKENFFTVNNIFIESCIQRYIAIYGLEDYAMPKPGWSASVGYDFFRGHSHSGIFSINTGHNVVAGSNPLVRMLDIWPLTAGLG